MLVADVESQGRALQVEMPEVAFACRDAHALGQPGIGCLAVEPFDAGDALPEALGILAGLAQLTVG